MRKKTALLYGICSQWTRESARYSLLFATHFDGRYVLYEFRKFPKCNFQIAEIHEWQLSELCDKKIGLTRKSTMKTIIYTDDIGIDDFSGET